MEDSNLNISENTFTMDGTVADTIKYYSFYRSSISIEFCLFQPKCVLINLIL